MSTIKNVQRLLWMRKRAKKDRIETGRCQNCGRVTECEGWCEGPRFFADWLTLFFKYPRFAGSFWHMYKHELYWAGVEPWHRY